MHPNYPASPQPGYPPQQGYPTQYPPQQDYPSYVPQYPPQACASGEQYPSGGYPPQQQYPQQYPGGYPLTNSGGYPSQPGYPPQGYPQSPGYPPAGQPGYPPAGQPGYPPAGQPGYPPAGQPGYPPQGFSAGAPNSFFGAAPQQVKTSKNRCTVNYSKTMGITTGFFEKGSSPSLKGFPTYQMELYYVDEIFQGKVQPWNKKYDKAQQIYGPGITSSVLRKTITTQHAYLYRSTDQNEFHEIGDVHELLNLLGRGRKDGQVIFYTYVIINGTWRFSQTGPSTVKDLFSKHACHANCSESVTYSGEFHFQDVRERNTMKLVIDNNSGTFGPDKNDLPKVAELFRRNFPGLEVEALDYADPVLKGYLERAKANNALVARGGNNPSPY